MVAQAVRSYKELFDERIENSTFVVLVIGWMIILVGLFVPNTHASNGYMKSSIFEYSHSMETENIIMINDEEYIIYITKK